MPGRGCWPIWPRPPGWSRRCRSRWRRCGSAVDRHDPGRVAVDVAVMLADSGEAISDLAVLRDQPELFGQVASPATAWRVLDGIDFEALARMRAARAQAREVAWAQHADTC